MKGTRANKKRIFTLLTVVMFSMVLIGKAEENPFEGIFDDWANPKPASNFKVWVHITCDNKNTKAFIESHIKRELRSLQDVDLVGAGEGSGYELIVGAVEPVSVATGRKTGDIGLGWTFLKQFDNKPLLSKYTSAVDRDGIQEMTRWLYHSPKNGILIDDTKELDALCKDVVVKFDTQMLEPDRKAR